jgi:4'-phosphopantetheinyl transferase
MTREFLHRDRSGVYPPKVGYPSTASGLFIGDGIRSVLAVPWSQTHSVLWLDSPGKPKPGSIIDTPCQALISLFQFRQPVKLSNSFFATPDPSPLSTSQPAMLNTVHVGPQGSAADIAIWLLAYVPLCERPGEVPEDVLSAAELERARSFMDVDARDQYTLGRMLLRTVLSAYAKTPSHEWRFETNDFGKPRVAAPAAYRHLRFNLSHTRGLVACVVSDAAEVGIDVESRVRELDISNLAPTVLTPAEMDKLRSFDASQEKAYFLTTWTLKEAYVKACGEGLSMPLDTFSFDLHESGASIRFVDKSAGDASEWRFFRCDPTADHTLAVAIRTHHSVNTTLHWAKLG